MKWIEERTRESHKTILRKSMICERSACRDSEIKRVRQERSPDSEMHFEVRRRGERLFGWHRIFQVSVASFELSLTPPYVPRHFPFTAQGFKDSGDAKPGTGRLAQRLLLQ